jgi:hypothetical protein
MMPSKKRRRRRGARTYDAMRMDDSPPEGRTATSHLSSDALADADQGRNSPRDPEGRTGDSPRDPEGRTGDSPRDPEGRTGDSPRDPEGRTGDSPRGATDAVPSEPRAICAICCDAMYTRRSVVRCMACKRVACKKCAHEHIIRTATHAATAMAPCFGCDAPWSLLDLRRRFGQPFIDGEYFEARTSYNLADELAIARRTRIGDHGALFKCEAAGCDGTVELLSGPQGPQRQSRSASPLRPDVRSASPLRPDGRSASPLRPDGRSASPLRPDGRSASPLRPDGRSSDADAADNDDIQMILSATSSSSSALTARCCGEATIIRPVRAKCNECEREACPHCHRVIADAAASADASDASPIHECSEDDIASHRIIAATTRPCPGCMASIEKKNGCDDMYCVTCRTKFHWGTGEQLPRTDRYHNPEEVDRAATVGLYTRPLHDVINIIPNLIVDRLPTLILTPYVLAVRAMTVDVVTAWLGAYEVRQYGDNADLRRWYAATRAARLRRFARTPLGTDARPRVRDEAAIARRDEREFAVALATRERDACVRAAIHALLTRLVFDAARLIRTLAADATTILRKYVPLLTTPASTEDDAACAIERLRVADVLEVDYVAILNLLATFEHEAMPRLTRVFNRDMDAWYRLFTTQHWYPSSALMIAADERGRPFLRVAAYALTPADVARVTRIADERDASDMRLRDATLNADRVLMMFPPPPRVLLGWGPAALANFVQLYFV